MNLMQMSVSGAILILAIVIVRAVTVDRLPKKAFLALWGIALLRLLIPVSLPSAFSIYTLVGRNTPMMETGNHMTGSNFLPFLSGEQLSGLPNASQAVGAVGSTGAGAVGSTGAVALPSIWTILWVVGATACLLFFAASYLSCRREFQASLPLDNDFLKRWLADHQIRRPLAVRQSSRISAPLSYGILRPVILMLKSTDWEDTETLQYVLAHEYIHVQRFDALTKLIVIAAVCIHWFNPMVWLMYILANRDLELSCDESVVRKFGVDAKSAYARTLIRMEETKCGFTPLCNSFSKNAIEERITAIMKTRKTSLAAMALAAILVAGVAVVFATSATGTPGGLGPIPGTDFTDGEYEKLLALRYEGYENMTVSDYRERVLRDTDTAEYADLLERFWQDETIYDLRDTDETAAFLCYTLVPLRAENWQVREFGGYVSTENPEASDQATLEYWGALTILDGDGLTVGEYNNARLTVVSDLQAFLKRQTEEMLQDETAMQSAVASEVNRLEQAVGTDALQVSLQYTFNPLSKGEGVGMGMSDGGEREPRQYPRGTAADYESLLALRVEGYQNMSVEDFNAALLEWGNRDFDRTQRIQEDVGKGDYGVELTEEERFFVSQTAMLSNEENYRVIQSWNTGKPEEDPWCGGIQLYKNTDDGSMAAWCHLWYQFSYHIVDKDGLTVGERDRRVTGFIKGIQSFWDGTSLEELLTLSEDDVVSRMEALAAEYSGELLEITVHRDQVQFECMDEREFNRN